jgi:hypothetical protein
VTVSVPRTVASSSVTATVLYPEMGQVGRSSGSLGSQCGVCGLLQLRLTKIFITHNKYTIVETIREQLMCLPKLGQRPTSSKRYYCSTHGHRLSRNQRVKVRAAVSGYLYSSSDADLQCAKIILQFCTTERSFWGLPSSQYFAVVYMNLDLLLSFDRRTCSFLNSALFL